MTTTIKTGKSDATQTNPMTWLMEKMPGNATQQADQAHPAQGATPDAAGTASSDVKAELMDMFENIKKQLDKGFKKLGLIQQDDTHETHDTHDTHDAHASGGTASDHLDAVADDVTGALEDAGDNIAHSAESAAVDLGLKDDNTEAASAGHVPDASFGAPVTQEVSRRPMVPDLQQLGQQLWDLDNIDLGFVRLDIKPLKEGMQAGEHTMPLQNIWKVATSLLNFRLGNEANADVGVEQPVGTNRPELHFLGIELPRLDGLSSSHPSSQRQGNSFI